MKTWKLFLVIALAAVAHSQDSYLSISLPSVSGDIPSCAGTAYSFQLTGTSAWGLYCNNTRLSNGTLSGTGNGACPTSFGSLAPCNDPSGSAAPTFSIYPQPQLISGTWSMYMQIGNASIGSVGDQNLPPFTCQPPSYTQAIATTLDQPCKACPPNVRYCQTGSPIVIDPTGEGFFLTDKQHGVRFREGSNAPLIQMSWTDPAHHNAWLVRPNADGSVTSLASNLFGNLSPQPSSSEPNGYAALAYWATREGCGKISWLDFTSCPAVWKQLELWHDANQDGIAQPDELQTLEAAGVSGISLESHENAYVDQYGNQFVFESKAKDSAGHEANRTYDVFLVF